MNSILQCIFATAPLTEYFMGGSSGFASDKKIRKCNLSFSYYELLKEARRTNKHAVTPKELKS